LSCVSGFGSRFLFMVLMGAFSVILLNYYYSFVSVRMSICLLLKNLISLVAVPQCEPLWHVILRITIR